LASCPDNDGNTAIHHAIRMEKLHFLSFLLEGDYSKFENFEDNNFEVCDLFENCS